MFKNMKPVLLSALLILTITGCSTKDTQTEASSQASSNRTTVVSSRSAATTAPKAAASSQASSSQAASSQAASSQAASSQAASSQAASSEAESLVSEEESAEASAPVTETAAATTTAGELTVHFGDDGAPFTMYLYDNSTAAAIAAYVGTADWRLPIYNFDNYDNWEVMQYYDLPSRYEIPSNVETVTTEKTGEVYYSEPNRIVLFYGDGEVTGEYSRVGYFDATEEFISAVQENPELEGWGNKIILIEK